MQLAKYSAGTRHGVMALEAHWEELSRRPGRGRLLDVPIIDFLCIGGRKDSCMK